MSRTRLTSYSDVCFFNLPVWFVGAVLALVTLDIHSQVIYELDPLDPLVQPALISPRAEMSVLIAVTRAGDRIVAVGERGIIIWSDDNGRTWSQGKVPVQVTLTGVYFITPQKGWAVGHSGVVLATVDGAVSWTKQLDGFQINSLLSRARETTQSAIVDEYARLMTAQFPADPLFDVLFLDENNGFVIGAYGLFLRTDDAGETWIPWQEQLTNPDGDHLHAISVSTDDLIFIVGERGALYVSTDQGQTFVESKSGYDGSYFGVTFTRDNKILIYGLRGHVFRSSDQGQTWSEIDLNINRSWMGGALLDDGRIILVNQAGHIVLSSDKGENFELLADHGEQLVNVVETSSGDLVLVGMRGIQRIEKAQLK